MPLNIEAKWSNPIKLTNGQPGIGYACPDLETIPESPGVYVFGRRHGNSITPLYIGKALNLRQRVKQQFDSVNLMSRLQDGGTGTRFLIYCVPLPKRAQSPARVIKVLEDALIAHTLGEGHELRQKQGTLRPNHTISLSGNRTSEPIAGRLIRLRANRGS